MNVHAYAEYHLSSIHTEDIRYDFFNTSNSIVDNGGTLPFWHGKAR